MTDLKCYFLWLLDHIKEISGALGLIIVILFKIPHRVYRMIVNMIAERKSACFLKWIVKKYKKENFRKNETQFNETNQVRPRDPRKFYSSFLIKPGETYDKGFPIEIKFIDLEEKEVFPKKWISKKFPRTDHKIREKVFEILIEDKRLYPVKSLDGRTMYFFDRVDNPNLFDETDPIFRYGQDDV